MDRKLRINIVVPSLVKKKFTGGIYCIMKYADGLAAKGHEVNVIPSLRSKRPEWITCRANIIIDRKRPVFKGSFKKIRRNIFSALDQAIFKRKNEFTKRAILVDYMSYAIPAADVTIATAWDTAEIVYRFGTGKKAYFMQHMETVFFNDQECYERRLCELSYQLPIVKISNSSWLQGQLEDYLRRHSIKEKVHCCINAVDLDVYRKLDTKRMDTAGNVVRIISYGGNNMLWKGFAEMAEAMALARRKLPELTLEWLVYGNASLPPDNSVAPYTKLGFLQPGELVKAYNEADFLLSASWYESFPLFPIEAMACGLATITTQQGTEDYAAHGETAEVVKERDIDSIANAIVKLATDLPYREMLAQRGYQAAQRFSWPSSVNAMEEILNEICRG